MGLRMITPPTLEPITEAEAKVQCRIDGTEFDALVPGWIAAARSAAESRMQAVIMRRTVELTFDAFPEAEISLVDALPAWNPQHTVAAPLSISEVRYFDAAGIEQTLTSSAYTIDESSWPFWLLPAVDEEWPDTQDQANAVIVRVQTGYTSVTQVPQSLRQWLLMAVAFFKVQAELINLSGRSADIPSEFVDGLLDPYRLFTV